MLLCKIIMILRLIIISLNNTDTKSTFFSRYETQSSVPKRSNTLCILIQCTVGFDNRDYSNSILAIVFLDLVNKTNISANGYVIRKISYMQLQSQKYIYFIFYFKRKNNALESFYCLCFVLKYQNLLFFEKSNFAF